MSGPFIVLLLSLAAILLCAFGQKKSFDRRVADRIGQEKDLAARVADYERRMAERDVKKRDHDRS